MKEQIDSAISILKECREKIGQTNLDNCIFTMRLDHVINELATITA